jgi:hypothetical protein
LARELPVVWWADAVRCSKSLEQRRRSEWRLRGWLDRDSARRGAFPGKAEQFAEQDVNAKDHEPSLVAIHLGVQAGRHSSVEIGQAAAETVCPTACHAPASARRR